MVAFTGVCFCLFIFNRVTVKNTRKERRELILRRFMYYGLGSYGGGVTKGIARVQVRGSHAVTVFWPWDTVHVVVSMTCRMFLKPPGFSIANLYLCDINKLRNKLAILTTLPVVFAILQLRAIPYRARFLRLLICVYDGCCSSWHEPEIALVNQIMLPFDVRRIDQVSPSKSKETLRWWSVLVHRNT